MISVEEFNRLRLAQLSGEAVQQIGHRELYARDWVGERAGCVELLRPATRPESVGAAVIRLPGALDELAGTLLGLLGLELLPGMAEAEVHGQMGQPWRVQQIGHSGKAVIYQWGAGAAFDVLCLLWRDRGLSEIVVSARAASMSA